MEADIGCATINLSPSMEAIDLIGSFGSCERSSINDGYEDLDPPSSMVGVFDFANPDTEEVEED